MNKFIILQRPKLRVPLWAGEDDWTIQLTETKAYSLSIFMEAFFASLLYDGGKLEVLYTYLRTIDKELSPYLAETFVDVFKQCHPATYLGADGASYKDIQLLSVNGRCKIPIYAYDMEITEEDEKKIVSAIIKFPDNINERLGYWFSSTMTKYGIEYYPKLGYEQVEILRTNFLRIHGLSEWHAKQTDYTKKKPPYNPNLIMLCGVIGMLLMYVLAFWLYTRPTLGDSNAKLWSCMACALLAVIGGVLFFSNCRDYFNHYTNNNVPPKRKRR